MKHQYMRPGLAKIVTIIVVAWLQISAQPIDAQAEPGPDASEAIRRILSEVIDEDKAPGIVAAIISSKGVIASSAAGVRKAGSATLLKTSDCVYLGSCTKAMTCAMLATLVEEGKLGWDMTLTEAIPELKRHIHRDYHDITLWQLMTHRAGVEDCFTYDQHLTKEKRLGLLKKKLSGPPVHEQGGHYYSNLGYVAAACMAERVTGLLWETLMAERLFHPLGMTSAGFGFPGTRGQIDQPWGHQRSGDAWRPSQSDCSEALGPAGTVYCTIDDWAVFLSLFLSAENSLLDAGTMSKLVQPVGYYAGGWGVAESPHWAKGYALSHNGSNGMWYSSMIVAPGLDRAYVVITNSRDFGVTQDVCNEMMAGLIREDLNMKTTNDSDS
ncbi:MAG: beta-lactamase family protein [Gemmatimonadales bacterium]|nr:beta-lactamase family protein [Gemmatimonadales bacterium]